jgi:hypothetical protein
VTSPEHRERAVTNPERQAPNQTRAPQRRTPSPNALSGDQRWFGEPIEIASMFLSYAAATICCDSKMLWEHGFST